MEQSTLIMATVGDLEKVFSIPLEQKIKAELKARYNRIVVSVETVALIHGIHPHTVRQYAKSGDIECEPRLENAPFKFRLGNVLIDFDFKALNHILRTNKS